MAAVVEGEVTDRDLDFAVVRRGLEGEKGFLQRHLFPHFKADLLDRLHRASSGDELLRLQGAARFLQEQEDYVDSLLKRASKVQVF